MNKQIKVALPKGRLLAQTAARLKKAGWGLSDYQEKTRLYRITSQSLPNLSAKVFHERDIPIQVAIGNYDLGICGSDWIEELLTRYPGSNLLKVGNLGYGDGAIYAAGSPEGIASLEEVKARRGTIRLASEYPNLAESFALKLRLRRFGIFPLWGAAEAYPPESADLALVCGTIKELAGYGLVPLSRVLTISACLIANRNSWQAKNMARVVNSIYDKATAQKKAEPEIIKQRRKAKAYTKTRDENIVRLALPDGHQQEHTLRLLSKAGITIKDYPSPRGNRRPTTTLEGVAIKVIRPQDMPLQVANGNFDLAIGGRDWLREHLDQFPSSPVKELVDLRLGGVKIVAVVSQNLSISDVSGLRESNARQTVPLRVASEYINIADRYARDNHLAYRIIPTWGASEAFLPEDADLLIENTQTGRTIARHNLKIIDTIFESSACLIGSSQQIKSEARKKKVNSIIKALEKAAREIKIENY
jgi:ATP phosphoribosyltransferase